MKPMPEQQLPAKPWWRHGLLWMVMSGPIAVVIASCFTFWLAARGTDVMAEEAALRAPIQRQGAHDRALAPALQGRNHAATPAADAH